MEGIENFLKMERNQELKKQEKSELLQSNHRSLKMNLYEKGTVSGKIT